MTHAAFLLPASSLPEPLLIPGSVQPGSESVAACAWKSLLTEVCPAASPRGFGEAPDKDVFGMSDMELSRCLQEICHRQVPSAQKPFSP